MNNEEILIGLNCSNIKVGNYAKYISKKGSKYGEIICCGWMDIHEDSDNCGDNPIFAVNPIFWDDDAVFVLKNRSRYVTLNKRDFSKQKKISGLKIENGSFVFDCRQYHGLVPSLIAEKIVELNSTKLEEYNNFLSTCNYATSPKMVWRWIYNYNSLKNEA